MTMVVMAVGSLTDWLYGTSQQVTAALVGALLATAFQWVLMGRRERDLERWHRRGTDLMNDLDYRKQVFDGILREMLELRAEGKYVSLARRVARLERIAAIPPQEPPV